MKRIIFSLLLAGFALCALANQRVDTTYVSDPPEQTDSVRASFVKKNRELMMNPAFISRYVGTIAFTRPHIEESLDVSPVSYRGGVTYYELPTAYIGIEYYGKEDVAIEISFRMFGEDGLKYEKSLYDAGFKLTETSKTINVETGKRLDVVAGQVRRYKNGDVICDVYDGNYLGFVFYPVKN